MPLAFFLLVAAVLLLLNAFFVLAEFAAVKMRGTRIEELIDLGSSRAKIAKHIHDHIDQYLSVCQVGITFASIALGFVGEPLAYRLIRPLLGAFAVSSPKTGHAIVVGCGVLLVSFVHVLIGEQVPKMIAIGSPDRAALWTAPPLRIARLVLIVPLWLLNTSTKLILRLLRLPQRGEERHSEDELRIILSRSHSSGMMSFRRLLFMENVFDFGELKVCDAMRVRSSVRTLRLDASWEENLRVIREARFSRYPLLPTAGDRPLGIVHVKDLFLSATQPPDLARLVRPFITVAEDLRLEHLLTDMQRRRIHFAIVMGREARWSGLITMEDIIEEIIGTIEDEFASDPPIYLADVLTAPRVVLGIEAESAADAIRQALTRVPAAELPLPAEDLVGAIVGREKLVSTYLGRGIGMPHARLPRLAKPVLIFARSALGIPVPGSEERMHLLFILLTPAGLPRVHQRLQARIAGILESEFVDNRLREALTPVEILEAIRTGEQTALD